MKADISPNLPPSSSWTAEAPFGSGVDGGGSSTPRRSMRRIVGSPFGSRGRCPTALFLRPARTAACTPADGRPGRRRAERPVDASRRRPVGTRDTHQRRSHEAPAPDRACGRRRPRPRRGRRGLGCPGGHGPRSHGGGHRLTVVEHATTDATTDTGAAGDSAGDVLTFANDVFDETDATNVGTDQGYCVRVVAGSSYECTWTTLLPGGQIVVAGPFYDAKDSVLAITGGTGRNRNARGTMLLQARAGGTKYAFTFRIIG